MNASAAAVAHIQRRFASDGPTAATDLAALYLASRTISPGTYIQLVRWSEGRPAAL